MGRSDRRLTELINSFGVAYENLIFYNILSSARHSIGDYVRPVVVSVNDYGTSTFYVDKEFFNLEVDQQKSLLVRECMRLLLEHPLRRPKDVTKDADKELWRTASDLTLNHYLHTYLEYDVEGDPTLNEIGYKGPVVVEDVFKYLKSLTPPDSDQKQKGDGQKSNKSDPSKEKSEDDSDGESDDDSDGESDDDSDGESDDDSDGESDDDSDGEEDQEEASDEVSEAGLKKLVESTAQKSSESETVIECAEADKKPGTEPGTLLRTFESKRIKPKPKWEQVIKKWTRKGVKENYEEQWVSNPIALDSFLRSKNSRLPGDRLTERLVAKAKVPVVCYADVSGSCTEYFDRFMKASLTIPLDKFEVELRAFDTRVYKVDRNQIKIPGGGGTSVEPVVADYNKLKTEKGRDTHCFVITDGYFNMPAIKEEDRRMWHFFITEGYSTTQYIPEGCHVYKLEDFE